MNSFRVFRVFRGDDGCYERGVAAGNVGGLGHLPSRVTGFGGAWDAIGWRKKFCQPVAPVPDLLLYFATTDRQTNNLKVIQYYTMCFFFM